jgi:hypothetical protein
MGHNELAANGEQCLNCLSHKTGQAHYAAILLNDNASAVDVAVEIRLSPPMVEACA